MSSWSGAVGWTDKALSRKGGWFSFCSERVDHQGNDGTRMGRQGIIVSVSVRSSWEGNGLGKEKVGGRMDRRYLGSRMDGKTG